ncbi:MAG: hypothetical protein QG572_1925, partial [Pseudomonadota bacterium]|nr:hypothetical protein [Pseudomonadota bacterium]
MTEPNTPVSIRHNRKQTLRSLGLILFAVYALFAYELWDGYHNELKRAQVTTRNYAAALESRLDATLRHADRILLALAKNLPPDALSQEAAPRYNEELRKELDTRLINFDELSSLRVLDADGRGLYASNTETAWQRAIGDRTFFRELRDNANAGLVVSEVFVSENGASTYLILARAIRGKDGGFLGVAAAEFNLAYYQKLFQGIDLGPSGAISLRRSDTHAYVTRWPDLIDEINKPFVATHPIVRLVAEGKTPVTYRRAAQVDGVARVFSVHALKNYPFYFTVGQAEDDVLREWRHQTLLVGAAAILLLAFLLALLSRLWKSENAVSKTLKNLQDSE